MTKDEKKKAAFERMTAEQRKEAEAKAKARAEKKAAAAKAAQSAPYEPNIAEKLAAKRQFLKELSLYFKAVQLGRAEYKPVYRCFGLFSKRFVGKRFEINRYFNNVWSVTARVTRSDAYFTI